jgi:hypothetical protein
MISAVILITATASMPDVANAQMRVEYPDRFRFFGVVELSYRNFYVETTSNKYTIDRSNQTFRQYYKAGVEGFIYHPRLAIFSASISYNDTRFFPEKGQNVTTSDIGYDILTTFLPYRPVAFDFYARKIDYTFNYAGDPVDTTSLLYGARLRMHKRNWPSIRLEYYHWEYDLLRFKSETEKRIEDRYILDVRGSLRLWATKYQLYVDYLTISRPEYDDSIMSVRLSTNSTLRKSIYWYNWVSYVESDYYKMSNFSSSLYFPPGKRFQHNYLYEHLKSENKILGSEALGIENKKIELKTESVTGSWGYRFTERLNGSLSLRYTKNDLNGTTWDTDGVSASMGYSRPISWVRFSSYYRLFLRKDERRGDLQEHILELNLSTSRFRWGIVYSRYYFSYIDETQKYIQRTGEDDFFLDQENVLKRTSETYTHSVSLGIRGRVPGRAMGRAYWNVEAEYFQSDTNGERPKRFSEDDFFEEDIQQYEEYENDIRQFELTGNLFYPLEKGIVFNFRTSYLTGSTNDRSRTTYYYEGVITYPVSRRFGILVLWRQTWSQIEGYPDREESRAELKADYRLGKTYFSFESWLRKVNDDGERIDRIIYLRVRRVF